MNDNGGYVNDESSGMTSFSLSPLPPKQEEHAHEKFDEIQVDDVGFGPRKNSVEGRDSLEDTGPYAGMPKEVLLKYSRQKKFVWARNILTLLVMAAIATLIALVIAIIVISPPCLDYWQTSPIYQIYPKSFRDSYKGSTTSETETDGIGDIQGIIEKLDYLNNDLGVRVLWLNPIYQSPEKDNGYDISDFRDIAEQFGGMEQLDKLIIEMHNRGMKLVMDFVPNHSSDQHEWFKASSDSNHAEYDKYKDYYMWHDSDVVPNNWVSEFDNASAWTLDPKRKEYYFHGFYKEQPDLNLRNPTVLQELKDILSFWLEKGVDGFRCDALAFMLEAEHLRDNPVPNNTLPVNKDNIFPDYTQNYKGVHDIVADWRALMDEYSTEPGVYRFMETEVYAGIQETMRYYGTKRAPEGDFPMNFLLITADPDTEWNANSMREKVLEWMTNMPAGKWANWVISNHDNSRLPSRVGSGLARSAAVMIMTLPGTPGLYYGDEIGMTDNYDIPGQKDFRDPERTPMQWNEGDNAGFCDSCNPWLPVNENYPDVNVETQMKTEGSMFKMYQRLISLRQAMVYQRGYLCVLPLQSPNTFAYVRELPGISSKIILINFDENGDDTTVNLGSYSQLSVTGSIDFISDATKTELKVGQSVNFSSLKLSPSTAIIVSYDNGDNLFHSSAVENVQCFIHTKVCYNKGLDIVQTC